MRLNLDIIVGNDAGNAIDFFVWDRGTDATTAIGTKHVMTLDGDGEGRVGIGTTSPAHPLDVRANNARVLIEATNAGGNAFLSFCGKAAQ